MKDCLQQITRKFRQGGTDYHLLQDGDRILIALSGGKDSLMLCRLLAQQARIHRPAIHIEAAHVVMDNIPYDSNIDSLSDFCKELGIKLHILHSSFEVRPADRRPACFLCSWHRRKALFQFATEQHFNKIALGHHQDDILVTWLMNITYEGNAGTMHPLMQMEHYPLQVIRPLCLVQEEWIREAAEELQFPRQRKACPYERATRRADMHQVFQHLQQLNPEARYSLWRAAGLS